MRYLIAKASMLLSWRQLGRLFGVMTWLVCSEHHLKMECLKVTERLLQGLPKIWWAWGAEQI